MSAFYSIAYRLGFTPWESAESHPPAAQHVAALFDRESHERGNRPGAALDLGCGGGHWAIDLARRGWEVTAVDIVPRAVARTRNRAAVAGVTLRALEGDVTDLDAAMTGTGFDFFWDFGTLHGLTPGALAAAARAITAASAPDATLLMLAWSPGRRFPLPRGVDRAEIEAAFTDWSIIDVAVFDATGLPPPLRGVDPQVYRLRRR